MSQAALSRWVGGGGGGKFRVENARITDRQVISWMCPPHTTSTSSGNITLPSFPSYMILFMRSTEANTQHDNPLNLFLYGVSSADVTIGGEFRTFALEDLS